MQYWIKLACFNKKIGETVFITFLVTPSKIYGNKLGKELVKKYRGKLKKELEIVKNIQVGSDDPFYLKVYGRYLIAEGIIINFLIRRRPQGEQRPRKARTYHHMWKYILCSTEDKKTWTTGKKECKTENCHNCFNPEGKNHHYCAECKKDRRAHQKKIKIWKKNDRTSVRPTRPYSGETKQKDPTKPAFPKRKNLKWGTVTAEDAERRKMAFTIDEETGEVKEIKKIERISSYFSKGEY